MSYSHLVLRVDDPVGDLVSGEVQDAFTSKVCGGWAIGTDGFIHVFLDSGVNWEHQLIERVAEHVSIISSFPNAPSSVPKPKQQKFSVDDSGTVKWS